MTSGEFVGVHTVKEQSSSYVQYFQCPYCLKYVGGHTKRVPKSIGKFRVKTINNFLIFVCSRCGKEFRVQYLPKKYLWSKMSRKQRDVFKLNNYKGGKKQDDKNI